MLRYDKRIKIIFENEGGYVNDKDDAGGKTNYGISTYFLRSIRSNLKRKNITKYIAKKLYKKYFWNRVNRDNIKSYDLSVNVFDMAVNRGVKTSVKLLQKVLNKDYNQKLIEDGIIGKKTLSILNKIEDEKILNIYYTIERIKYYKKIGKKRNNNKFLKGWINRRNKFI